MIFYNKIFIIYNFQYEFWFNWIQLNEFCSQCTEIADDPAYYHYGRITEPMSICYL